MKQRHSQLIEQILFLGLGTYGILTGISWLFSWILVSNSFCKSYDLLEKECGIPLYPKWEYLSLLYSQEFVRPIQQAIAGGCQTEEPLAIKVMQRQHNTALVWFKGESGSTWLASFIRGQESEGWRLFKSPSSYGEEVCHVDIIHSRLGGSADDYYWYN
jgi:hypothetical protein